MGESDGRPIQQLFWNQQEEWSGRGDLNARPPAPKGEAWLPKAPFVRAHSLCLQQLGESAFRSEASPRQSRGWVLAQFWHSCVGCRGVLGSLAAMSTSE